MNTVAELNTLKSNHQKLSGDLAGKQGELRRLKEQQAQVEAELKDCGTATIEEAHQKIAELEQQISKQEAAAADLLTQAQAALDGKTEATHMGETGDDL